MPSERTPVNGYGCTKYGSTDLMDKILVIQTAFIGDAVLTLPMVQKLKEMYPSCLIDVVCTPTSAGLLSSSPYVNEVISYNKRGKEGSVFNIFRFARRLKANKYIKIYSPHRSARTALLVMLIGVKDTYSFTNSALKHIYRYLTEYRSDFHEVQRNLELAGFDTRKNDWRILPEVKINQSISEKINSYYCDNFGSRTVAAVAPGSVWETKKFPKEYFIEIIKYLRDELDMGVVLIGGEADAEYCSEIARGCGAGVVSSAGKFNIIESIELIRRSALLISNDSAPAHFAMCAGTPALTIYCSTVPEFGFYPYSKQSGYVSYDRLECKPCGIHGHKECPTGTFDCAHKLDHSIIKNKITELLNGK